MTPGRAVAIAADHYTEHFAALLRTSPRGTITAVIIGGYLGGVAAMAGGLVLAGIRIGRKQTAHPTTNGA